MTRPFDPFKNAFYGPLMFGWATYSLPIDLKGTQAILCAETPVLSAEKTSLPGNVPDRDFCHAMRFTMREPR